jgi:hypothetical protein
MAVQDQVIISFNGSQYVMPAKVGIALFTALTGADIYKLNTHWERVGERHQDVQYISPVQPHEAPALHAIGTVQFHVGIENQRVKEEEERKKNASGA